MGRPREHGDDTRRALLTTAEALVRRRGVEALSVRHLAEEVETSTRAVYSLFGSKAGLVDALGQLAFDWLADALDAIAPTEDPAADLVEAGASGFRRLVIEHPGLFRVGVLGAKPGAGAPLTRDAADRALGRLSQRLHRLDESGGLRNREIHEAAMEFHALCEGLASLELRGSLPAGEAEHAWRNALATLTKGLAAGD